MSLLKPSNLFLSLVLILNTCTTKDYSKSDFIRIEHFGPSDEQIKVLVISLSEKPKEVDWERNYVVTQKRFSEVEEFVSDYVSNIPRTDKKTQDWIVFRVTTSISGSTTKQVLPIKEVSVDFFSKLSSLLAKHTDDKTTVELKDQVDVILEQISW